jgi:hypothetical protein
MEVTVPPKHRLTFNGLALFASCFHAGFLFGFFFDPEDGGNMFL